MFMKRDEQDFFMSFIYPYSSVLEYGSGDSTIEISERAKSLVSVEHDKGWFDKISGQIRAKSNVRLILKQPNIALEDGFADGSYEEFEDYIKAPIQYYPFDVVLIDGRARVECAKNVSQHCNNETFVFIHDYNTNDPTRSGYTKVLDWFDIVECVNTMCWLRKKVK